MTKELEEEILFWKKQIKLLDQLLKLAKNEPSKKNIISMIIQTRKEAENRLKFLQNGAYEPEQE